MNAKTALEKIREKKVLYAVKTPEGKWVLTWRPALFRVQVDEGDNTIVIDDAIFDYMDSEQPCYEHLFECRGEKYYYAFLEKLDNVRLYPRFKTVEERSDPDGDRLIVQRVDGVRFRVEPGHLLNVVANIETNPGISLGDLHGIIATIYAHDVPEFFGASEEEAQKANFKLAVGVALLVGFLHYEADLVELAVS